MRMHFTSIERTVRYMRSQRPPQRWTCLQCGIVNRAYREICFIEGCESARVKQEEVDKEINGITEFKDENSHVICRLSPTFAERIKADLVFVIQGLVELSPPMSEEAVQKTTLLQKQMRKGFQSIQDFHDPVALWGYTRRKFFSRAITAFELFRSAKERKVLLNYNEDSFICSIGGGPGNDLFGFLLFQKYCCSGMVDGRTQNKLHVFDFCSGWQPIVQGVAELSGYCIDFHTCDISQPLRSEVNRDVCSIATSLDNRPLVIVFCYVLNEIMGPHGDPPAMLHDLLTKQRARKTTILFREPNSSSLNTIVSRYLWVEGKDYWKLSFGGLAVELRQEFRED